MRGTSRIIEPILAVSVASPRRSKRNRKTVEYGDIFVNAAVDMFMRLYLKVPKISVKDQKVMIAIKIKYRKSFVTRLKKKTVLLELAKVFIIFKRRL